MQEEVVNRPPKTGQRLKLEKKRKAAAKQTGKSKEKQAVVECAVEPPLNPALADPTAVPGARGEAAIEEKVKEEEEEEEQSTLLLYYNTVRTYVSAVNELWDYQHARNLVTGGRPKGVAIKAMERALIRGKIQRDREEYRDRGRGTLRDGYNSSQLADFMKECWSLPAKSTSQAQRTGVDFLFGHSMLMRGQHRRMLELADLLFLNLDKEGTGPAWCVCVVTNQGKTNQHGRIECAAALRHRHYQICALGALACHFFWRWHRTDEPFPTFTRSEDWYSIKVIQRDSKNNTQEVSYQTENQWVSRIFKAIGVISSHTTHIPREAGAKLAELAGVAESQVSYLYSIYGFLLYRIRLKPFLYHAFACFAVGEYVKCGFHLGVYGKSNSSSNLI